MQKPALRGPYERVDGARRLALPRQAARILRRGRGKCFPGQMHAREHPPGLSAMMSGGRHLYSALQSAHQRCRLAAQQTEWRAIALRNWNGHGHPARRQMPHEIQIKRQRARRKVFKNREHIRPARRCPNIKTIFLLYLALDFSLMNQHTHYIEEAWTRAPVTPPERQRALIERIRALLKRERAVLIAHYYVAA